MDVVMPNMGGVAAAIEIRQIDRRIPILFQTGYGERTQLEAAGAITDASALQKPVQIPELLNAVAERMRNEAVCRL